ncbi:MAG: DUF3156 family protein [Deltaproteobacteria bacterium]|nr:DUF3156 family protein [Deltaproteobacteria bacterium]
MIVLVGAAAIPRTATGPGAVCERCGAAAVDRRVDERVGHLFFAPLVPLRFRMQSRCTRCGHVDRAWISSAMAPRRAATGRIAITWALLAGLIAGVAIAEARAPAPRSARIVAPAQGDVWTLDTRAWHAIGTDLPNVRRYVRVHVDRVAGWGIVASLCDITADDQAVVERECRAYPRPIGGMTPEEVAQMRAGGVIVAPRDVREPDDADPSRRAPIGTLELGVIALAVALIVHAVRFWRWRKDRGLDPAAPATS